MKNVAFTPFDFNISNILGVIVEDGPSSNVKYIVPLLFPVLLIFSANNIKLFIKYNKYLSAKHFLQYHLSAPRKLSVLHIRRIYTASFQVHITV